MATLRLLLCPGAPYLLISRTCHGAHVLIFILDGASWPRVFVAPLGCLSHAAVYHSLSIWVCSFDSLVLSRPGFDIPVAIIGLRGVRAGARWGSARWIRPCRGSRILACSFLPASWSCDGSKDYGLERGLSSFFLGLARLLVLRFKHRSAARPYFWVASIGWH